MHAAAVVLTILGGVATLAGLVCAFMTVRTINSARRDQERAMSDPSYQSKQLTMSSGHPRLMKPKEEWGDIEWLQDGLDRVRVTQLMEDRMVKMLLYPLADTRWPVAGACLLVIGVVASTTGATLALYLA